MTIDELKGILVKPKSDSLVFNKQTPKSTVLAWYICSFANSEGGQIVVGVDDNKNIVGINPSIVRNALEKANSLYDGSTQIKFDQIRTGKGKQVVIITVAKSLEFLQLHQSLYRKGTIVEVNQLSNSKEKNENNIATEVQDFPLSQLSLSLVDSNVKTCFNTDVLVEAFMGMMRDASVENPSNTCFFGVFGCWGRGKSHFLRLLRDRLSKAHSTDYDYIDFNAWKHQKTPEIWYHLLNTLVEYKSRWFKFCMWMTMNWGVLLTILIILVASFFAVYLTKKTPADNGKYLTWVAVLSGSIALITAYFSYVNGLLDLASKKLKRVKLNADLGVQYEIERRIEWLLKHWNGKLCAPKCRNRDRKVILAVEDIDRCDNESMIGIIEALKLVLENHFVRRRLIVVTTVDGNKLIEAYSLKYGQSCKQSNSKAVGQMDKVFLGGISLPVLTSDEQIEFIENVAGQIPGTTFTDSFINKIQSTSGTPKEKGVEDNTNAGIITSDDDESIDNLNLDTIVQIITNEIRNGVLAGAPPRKLRIIFYRMIMANNLLRLNSCKFNVELMIRIIKCSISDSYKKEMTDTPILEVVVPY